MLSGGSLGLFDRLNAKSSAIQDQLDGQPTKDQLRNIIDKAITKNATIQHINGNLKEN